MSTYVKLNSIHDSDIEEIESMPEKLNKFHDGEVYIEDYDYLSDTQKQELLSWTPISKKMEYHVEGANHWISYLLTGETEWNSGPSPLNFLNSSHRPLGELGFGAPSFYDSRETKALHSNLNSLDLKLTMQKYIPEKFMELGIGPRNYQWTENDRISMEKRLIELIEFIKSIADKSLGFYVSWE